MNPIQIPLIKPFKPDYSTPKEHKSIRLRAIINYLKNKDYRTSVCDDVVDRNVSFGRKLKALRRRRDNILNCRERSLRNISIQIDLNANDPVRRSRTILLRDTAIAYYESSLNTVEDGEIHILLHDTSNATNTPTLSRSQSFRRESFEYDVNNAINIINETAVGFMILPEFDIETLYNDLKEFRN